jgi:hypothetical protein
MPPPYNQNEPPAEDSELSISCEVTFRHGTLRLNGTVSEKADKTSPDLSRK